MQHSFHIPVLSPGYSIDTPIKVAKYGISSVVSVVDDDLTENMRKYYSKLHKKTYQYISKEENDSRRKRITAYLNLLDNLVTEQINALKNQAFENYNDLHLYFELLPETSVQKKSYQNMLLLDESTEKQLLQQQLKDSIVPGRIDVNFISMTDLINCQNRQAPGDADTDALAALRGFANSSLQSSLIISAGLNPKLFGYLEDFSGFYPGPNGHYHKKIVLTVSDYSSAMIQARILAKKGLWVSEFRIEPGLNGSDQRFVAEDMQLDPILKEFGEGHANLYADLFQLYVKGLQVKNLNAELTALPQQKITTHG